MAAAEKIPLADSVRNRMCQRCAMLLAPGKNCRIRARRLKRFSRQTQHQSGNETRQPTVVNRIVTTCLTCGNLVGRAYGSMSSSAGQPVQQRANEGRQPRETGCPLDRAANGRRRPPRGAKMTRQRPLELTAEGHVENRAHAKGRNLFSGSQNSFNLYRQH